MESNSGKLWREERDRGMGKGETLERTENKLKAIKESLQNYLHL